MRTAKVERSFGNKTSWDTPFETHFRNFAHEANLAVFDNGRSNTAISVDALETPTGADLVYLDPPYLNQKGVGVNYRDFTTSSKGLFSTIDGHTDRYRANIASPTPVFAWTAQDDHGCFRRVSSITARVFSLSIP